MLLLGAAAALGGRSLLAWHHLRACERALDRFHAGEAVAHLQSYLRLCPDSVRGHLLASRAFRRAGDTDLAERHLRQCRRLHPGPSEEIDLEWALLPVALGNLDEEPYLLLRARRSPAEMALALEALATGYTRLYRIFDALRCLERWLEKEPDAVGALLLRGDMWWHIQVPAKAVPDYRRVLELDPEHSEARWGLARCLVHDAAYD
jgi:tetratricopeptide (TPR) repeat protein